MDCFSLTLTPEDGAFHTAGGFLVASPEVTPKRLTNLKLKRDGTILAVSLVAGDPDSLETGLDDNPDVIQFEMFGHDGVEFYLFTHVQPESPATELLTMAEEYNLVLDTPFDIRPDGSLLVSVAGTHEAIQAVIQEFPTDLIRGDLRHVRTFEPTRSGVADGLTATQREIVRAALDRGYYRIPREVTQAELAADFDSSAPTIGEHLRKAEAIVLSEALE